MQWLCPGSCSVRVPDRVQYIGLGFRPNLAAAVQLLRVCVEFCISHLKNALHTHPKDLHQTKLLQPVYPTLPCLPSTTISHTDTLGGSAIWAPQASSSTSCWRAPQQPR